jgi:hypothetical protein
VEARILPSLIAEAKTDLASLGFTDVDIELHAFETLQDFLDNLPSFYRMLRIKAANQRLHLVPALAQISVPAPGTTAVSVGPTPNAAEPSDFRALSGWPDGVSFGSRQSSALASAPAAPRRFGRWLSAESDGAAVRGVCAGCEHDVLSNEGGREREGESYFHAGCIQGRCGVCGLIVHANNIMQHTDRVAMQGQYFHAACFDKDA